MANKPLVLVLDGKTDDLKRALRAGSADLADFTRSTEEVLEAIQAKVRTSLASSGADLADRMAKNIQQQVSGWKRGAEAALAMGENYNPLGGMNSASSLQAAEAQMRLAASYREQAAAAAQAKTANEQEAQVLRQLAVSSELAATEAERQGEMLRTQASAFAAMERQMGVTPGQAEATARAASELAQLEAAAEGLKNKLDPMREAQQRFDQELDLANRLLAAAVINQETYARAVEMAQSKLDSRRSALQPIAVTEPTGPTARELEQMEAAAARLRGQLDPMYLAQQRFDKELTVAEGLLQQGVITQREYDGAVALATRELQEHSEALFADTRASQTALVSHQNLTGMSRSMQFAMRDLSFQVSDVATSLSGGMPPMMVFSQQFGQIIGALQMAGNEGNAFLRFLGGPWGLALSTAAVAIVPLIGHLGLFEDKLKENADLIDKVKLGDDGLSEAQKVLGTMFDLATGKIKDQNEMLRLNARLTATKLRAEGMAEQESSNKTFSSARNQWTGGLSLTSIAQGALANLLPGDIGNVSSQMAAAEQARKIAKGVQAGTMSVEQAQIASRKVDFTGLAVNAETFNQALIDRVESARKIKNADSIDKALDTGKLDPSLMQTGNGRKPRADHTAERDAEAEKRSDAAYDEAYAEALARQADLARAGVTDLEQLAALDRKAINAARDKERAATEEKGRREQWSREDIDALQAQQQRASDGRKDAIDAKLKRDLTARDLSAQENALRLSDQLLEIQGQLAPTLAQRVAILRQIMENEKAQAVLAVKKEVNSGGKTAEEGAQKIGEIDQLYAARGKLFDRENAGPMGTYRNQLQKNVGDMNTALQNVQVDGLKGLEDGLTGIISGTESVSSAFRKMAASILADLARIAVEKTILSVIGLGGLNTGGTVASVSIGGRRDGGLLGYARGGIPGFAGGTRLATGMISGPGTGTSDSVLALVDGKAPIRVSNGEGIVNEQAVKSYWPMIDAMNKGTFPKFATGGLLSGAMASLAYPSIPSAQSLRAPAMNYTFAPVLTGAVMTEEMYAKMNDMAQYHAQRAGSAALAAAPALSQQRISDKSARRIPS